MFTPPSLTAVATFASAPGSFSTSMTRSVAMPWPPLSRARNLQGTEPRRSGDQDPARTVRSRIPSVAFSADSGMTGQAPVAFHFSSTFDQS